MVNETTLLTAAQTLTNESVSRWKSQGKKVLAFYCPYTPEEIVLAAGALPYWLRAVGRNVSPSYGDKYLMPNGNCSLCRHILDLALRGEFDFLDGLVGLNSCDHLRRTYDIWQLGRVKVRSPYYFHIISAPYKADERSIAWFEIELDRFRHSLSRHMGVEITEASLSEAIRTLNETRRLLRRVYESKKGKTPLVTGSEMVSIAVASSCTPRDEFNTALRQFLDNRTKNASKIAGNGGPRFMLVGSCVDHPGLTQLIEDSTGGSIVADYSCLGPMYFWDLVDESMPPMKALAKRYLKRLSCPRMVGQHQDRLSFIMDTVKQYQVDGIILQRLLNCDFWGGEGALLKWHADKAKVPVLELQREYPIGAVESVKTRVQAFAEMLI